MPQRQGNTLSLKWQLSHAVGYLQLGMYGEAEEELDRIAPCFRHNVEVLVLRVELFHNACDWPKLRAAAAELIEYCPENPGGWVSCAYATRRLEGIEAARGILEAALEQHPEEATIQFNLGCYGAQLGLLDEAEAYVREAIKLDPSFRKLAQQDDDLKPLRDYGLNFS